MSREVPTNTATISVEELTELLVSVEETAPETIDRGASKIEIVPPEEVTVADIDE